MRLEQNDTLLMIGDSITDAGRARPADEGLAGALGTGYVALVDALLNAWRPALNVRVINRGVGGHTVRDLAARWQGDVLDRRPDWVSVMVGTNDVWRQFDSPGRPDHVLPPEYARTLDALTARTRPAVKGLVLLTPFYLEPDRAEPMRARMDEYGAVVRETARRHGALFVDTQAAFDAVLAHKDPGALAGDRIHPSLTGHLVLARALLDALGFAWEHPR